LFIAPEELAAVQSIVRLGYAGRGPRTPRRPLTDVLVHDQGGESARQGRRGPVVTVSALSTLLLEGLSMRSAVLPGGPTGPAVAGAAGSSRDGHVGVPHGGQMRAGGSHRAAYMIAYDGARVPWLRVLRRPTAGLLLAAGVIGAGIA